jgi:hypothetical protein
MFGPEAPPLPWDTDQEYSRERVELYYLSNAGQPLQQVSTAFVTALASASSVCSQTVSLQLHRPFSSSLMESHRISSAPAQAVLHGTDGCASTATLLEFSRHNPCRSSWSKRCTATGQTLTSQAREGLNGTGSRRLTGCAWIPHSR